MRTDPQTMSSMMFAQTRHQRVHALQRPRATKAQPRIAASVKRKVPDRPAKTRVARGTIWRDETFPSQPLYSWRNRSANMLSGQTSKAPAVTMPKADCFRGELVPTPEWWPRTRRKIGRMEIRGSGNDGPRRYPATDLQAGSGASFSNLHTSAKWPRFRAIAIICAP